MRKIIIYSQKVMIIFLIKDSIWPLKTFAQCAMSKKTYEILILSVTDVY